MLSPERSSHNRTNFVTEQSRTSCWLEMASYWMDHLKLVAVKIPNKFYHETIKNIIIIKHIQCYEEITEIVI